MHSKCFLVTPSCLQDTVARGGLDHPGPGTGRSGGGGGGRDPFENLTSGHVSFELNALRVCIYIYIYTYMYVRIYVYMFTSSMSCVVVLINL